MGNLTITTDEETIKRARIRALKEGTSVNSVLAEYLRVYAGVPSGRRRALESLMRRSLRGSARRGNTDWSRDDLHERDA